MILETKRLILREMTPQDYPALCAIMQDAEVMYAYEGPFSEDETRTWLARQQENYKVLGFGLWAVVCRQTGEMIGQCGVTMQSWDGARVPEVGYLFQKAHWHKGYATEAAIACKEYGFDILGLDEVFSIIRDTNLPSQRVALRNGMSERARMIKHYRGAVIPHLVFSVRRPGYL